VAATRAGPVDGVSGRGYGRRSVLADVLTVGIMAGLPCAAAVLGTAIGYRQWKKQQSFERRKPFIDERRQAYKELWSRLEAIDVRLRVARVGGDEFSHLVRELNSFILTNEIYFDSGIRARVKAYLDAARDASEIAASYPDAFDVNRVRRERGLTEDPEIPYESMSALMNVVVLATEARDAIMREVQRNIGA
jgi:hypothetical protein